MRRCVLVVHVDGVQRQVTEGLDCAPEGAGPSVRRKIRFELLLTAGERGRLFEPFDRFCTVRVRLHQFERAVWCFARLAADVTTVSLVKPDHSDGATTEGVPSLA